MSDLERLKYLKVALRIVGIIMLFGFLLRLRCSGHPDGPGPAEGWSILR